MRRPGGDVGGGQAGLAQRLKAGAHHPVDRAGKDGAAIGHLHHQPPRRTVIGLTRSAARNADLVIARPVGPQHRGARPLCRVGRGGQHHRPRRIGKKGAGGDVLGVDAARQDVGGDDQHRLPGQPHMARPQHQRLQETGTGPGQIHRAATKAQPMRHKGRGWRQKVIGGRGRQEQQAHIARRNPGAVQRHRPGRHGQIADRLIGCRIVPAFNARPRRDPAGGKAHRGLDLGIGHTALGQVMAMPGHDDAARHRRVVLTGAKQGGQPPAARAARLPPEYFRQDEAQGPVCPFILVKILRGVN